MCFRSYLPLEVLRPVLALALLRFVVALAVLLPELELLLVAGAAVLRVTVRLGLALLGLGLL